MDRLTGIFAAAASPLRQDFSIDQEKLIGHCRWLLGEGGCDGVNLLGTTGEATSFTVAQRIAVMEAIAKADLPMERFMVGTGAAAMGDAVELTRAASELGFAGALLLPPFYYKDIAEDALVSYVAALIERACRGKLGIYLYHIPQFAGVSYSLRVVESLAARFPEIIAGVKDSTGDSKQTIAFATQIPSISIFPGSEAMLAKAPDAAFAGCISGTVNVTGAIVSHGWKNKNHLEGRARLLAALQIRDAIASYPLIPAVKRILAENHRDPEWRRVHPPLAELTDASWRKLKGDLAEIGYFEPRPTDNMI